MLILHIEQTKYCFYILNECNFGLGDINESMNELRVDCRLIIPLKWFVSNILSSFFLQKQNQFHESFFNVVREANTL